MLHLTRDVGKSSSKADMKVNIIFGLVTLLSGCTLNRSETPVASVGSTLPSPIVTTIPAPNPEIIARHFLDAWKQQDYVGMYECLSPQSQNRVTREEFVLRHEEIWMNIALAGLDYELISSLILSPSEAQAAYKVSLHSNVVGDVVYSTGLDLSRATGDWMVEWTDDAIHPSLTSNLDFYLDIVTPIRANIYDRNGLGLAFQTNAVALWIVPNQIGGDDDEAAMLSVLATLLAQPREKILSLYDEIRETDWRIVLGEVSLDSYINFESALSSSSGLVAQGYYARLYLDNGLAPHAIGYVSQLQGDELGDYIARGYRQDEFVGRSGLEAVYENELRGEPGGTLFAVDMGGEILENIASSEHSMPHAIYTTLDRDFQRQVERAIDGFAGAIVVIERDTGAVLAMESSPGFDPNLFDWHNPNSSIGLQELFSRPDIPLINRASGSGGSGYPLGSVFKIITMAAAIESGLYTQDTIYDCQGEFTEIPGQTLYDWTFEKELPPQGEITLVQALERSCNPYFYHIGVDLYRNELKTSISEMASYFGLGQETGIEIDEISGLIPDPDLKQEIYGEDWTERDAASLATGQSFLQVTPLQVARFIAAVGNGGTLYRPQLTLRIQNADGELKYEFEPEAQSTLPISETTIDAIQEGMVRVVRNPNGTVYRRFLGLNLNIAGKTGTAQTGQYTKPHAWFAGYTFEEREDKPDIAVVVILESQGEGSEWAAPIFRRVVESYFFGQPYSIYPWESRVGVVKTPTPTPTLEDSQEISTPMP